MKKRMKKLTALLVAISLCTGTVYAEKSTEAEAATEGSKKETQAETTALTELPKAETVQTEAAQTEAPQTEAPQTEAWQTEDLQTEAIQTETSQTGLPEETTVTETQGTETVDTEQSVSETEGTETEAAGTEGQTGSENATEGSSEPETAAETSDSENPEPTSESEEAKTDVKEETSEDETEQEEKKEPIIVKDENGMVLSQQEIKGPQKLTSGGCTYPVDYEEGVYRIQVSQDTRMLQITVPDQKGEEELILTRWNGYLAELEKTWLLCPDDPMADAFTSEGNTYSVNLEKYALDMELVTLEQLAVYGFLNEEASYAEIFVYSEERSQVLLVEFVSDEAVAETLVAEETETEEVMTLAASAPQINQSYIAAGENLAASAEKYTPTVASINGEWQILGLVRSGQKVDEELYSKYLENVKNTVKENDGVLHEKKYTEYSRVVLALTALGEDVTDVGGYNLLEPLADFDQTVWQGVNGAIFALIAFDSHDYEIPTATSGKTQTTRAKLINYILSKEVSGGGWNLSGRSADPDMTAMAIQALAPYYGSNTAVKNAVDRAVSKLSSLQNNNGGYGSYGTENSESCSQVIVALTALGIDPNTDPRFTKKGKSVVDALLSFNKKDGSFSHKQGGNSDQMATEQAYYALTSYQRFQNGQTSLYDMSDVALKSDHRKAAETEKLIKALPETITLAAQEQVQAAFSSYHKLTALQKSLISEESYGKLQAALKALEDLDAEVESEEQTEIDTEEETEAITEKDPDADNSNTGTDKNLSGTNKNPSGTNKKPSGTTKKVNLVSSTSRTGATSAGGSVPKGTSPKTAGDETESESEAESRFNKKNGSTQLSQAAKDVIKEIGSLLGTSKAAMKLPEEASEYTDAQVDSILEIYRSYEELEETEKEAVRQNKKYEEYLTILDKLKAANHYDEVTDTDLRENGEEILPWYIQMEVTPVLIEENCAAAVREALKGQGALLTLTDIHLIDLFKGGAWQPEDMVRVRIAETGQESFENLAVVHMKEDGGMEFIEAYISGDYLEFDTDHFSRFGIVGYNGAMEELMEDKKDEIYWIYLAPGAGAAVLLLLLLILRAAGSKKKKGVKNSER